MEAKVLNTINKLEIRKNDSDVRVVDLNNKTLQRIEENVVKVVDSGRVILKTSNVGPQGAQGEIGNLDSFNLESLSDLFRDNL